MSKSTTKNSPKPLEQVPKRLWIQSDDAGGIQLEAALPIEGDKPPLRRFSMTAYTGGAMQLSGWRYPVVVDLAGLRVPKKSRPILKDHDGGQIVGHTSEIGVTEQSLDVSGVVSGSGATAQEIIATSENGFPWQASLGATADKVVFITEGKKATANGREFTGPLYIARKSTLGEISFVALGADDDTWAHVAAGAGGEQNQEVNTMEFEQWAADNNLPIDDMDDKHVASLKAMFDKQQATPPPTVPVPPTAPAVSKNDPPPDPAAEMRAAAAAESKRIAAVRKVCNNEHPDIEAKAIEEGWDETKTELAVLRATRPKAPAIHTAPAVASERVLEAAACLSLGFDENKLTRQYGEQTMEAAHPMRNIGLRELVAECARLEGFDVPRVFGDGTATIHAGFSTVSLPGILENVMNKTLLAAYEATAIAAFDLCSVGSVSDFKEVSRYRLLGTGGFEQVAPDGELKHGKLSEQKYSNKADTYGQVVFLTRQEIINDDLGAFMDVPTQMGRDGAQVVDELFFTLLLSNPNNFFSTSNGNYLEGATTAFGPDSLTTAKTQFRKQKAGPGTNPKDQKPINIRPESLVVPVELETDAELLMGSAQLMIDASGTKTKIPVDNPHRNKYRVISAPHLSDTYFSGASGKAWYLFANPSVISAFEIVFLNGRRTPVIERVEAPPNNLGMGFRGYLDVGVKEQDPRGAVKVKGEA
ncbi:MAG: Mu-like prophage major head subunit gpT family protein [Planctomycetales bacterium]|nr:Mu-like prophage major head subunit gpT family protein [Planctomycetales bacterium]